MTALVRKQLRDALKAVRDAHPGLLLQRGWTDYVQTDASNEGAGGKSEHLKRICAIPAPDIYQHAYQRWQKATSDTTRFAHVVMKIEGRLLIGLAGGGALETGCAVSHAYGMPYLPGSSIKGVTRAYAEKALGKTNDTLRELFGVAPTETDATEFSGLVAFHDAWWVPESGGVGHKNQPFATDIVTPHHPDYYKGKGDPATDLDSPVPNALVGVRGSFLFTLEGPAEWLPIAQTLMEKALEQEGIGAKTRAGYGYLSIDSDENSRLERLIKEAARAEMSDEDRYRVEIQEISEKQLAEKFGTNLNATRDSLGADFDLYAGLAKELHASVIDSWRSETKKTNKARFKAYRFFAGDQDVE